MRIFSSVIIWFIIGCVLMLLVSFTVYGKIQSHYDNNKKDRTAKLSKLMMSVSIMVLITLFTLMFDYFTFRKSANIEWQKVLLSNLSLLMSLSIFDAVIIDIWILTCWKPKFFRVEKDYPSMEYMKKHIRMQFTIGLIPIVLLSVAVTVILFQII